MSEIFKDYGRHQILFEESTTVSVMKLPGVEVSSVEAALYDASTLAEEAEFQKELSRIYHAEI